MPIYKQKCGGTLSPVRQNSVVWETDGAETAFFILFPSACTALTHPTQQGTHVMHHSVISDSEVEVITLGRLLRQARRSYVGHRSVGLGDNSFQCRDSPWWTGEPRTPSTASCLGVSSEPLSRRQRVGRLVSLLICHGWMGREGAGTFSSGTFSICVDLVMQPHRSVITSEIYWADDTFLALLNILITVGFF